MEASTCHNMTLDTYTFQFFVSIVTSKMELFGTVLNSFYFLRIITKNSILDVSGALDPTLTTDIFFSRDWIRIVNTNRLIRKNRVMGEAISKRPIRIRKNINNKVG